MKKLLLVISVALFVNNNVNAQWHTNGPAGKVVFSLVVNDTTIFAGTLNGGVYSSTNNGSSWVQMNKGLTDTAVKSIAVRDTNIFAATADSGVFLFNHSDSAWVAINNGLTYPNVASLAISDSNIFAGTDGGGAFLSKNNGSSWAPLNIGAKAKVYSLTISDSAIFGSTDSTLFLSVDNGSNWVNASNGLPNSGGVYSLAIKDSTIFAGTIGDDVWQQTITKISGIQQIQAATTTNFIVYPNPANNNFAIQNTTTGTQLLEVFDITGKLISSENIYSAQTTIDASRLTDGIYVVSIKSDSGVATEKLVVVK